MRKEGGEEGIVRQKGRARGREEVSVNRATHYWEMGGERSRERKACGKGATSGSSREVLGGTVHGAGGGNRMPGVMRTVRSTGGAHSDGGRRVLKRDCT